MTIPGLIIINLLIGASVAYGARIQIRNLLRPMFYNRYFSALVLLEFIVLLPVGLYYNGFYPDWSWMYLIDTRHLSSGIHFMALAAYPMSATLGYMVGYFSARSNSDWVTLIFVVFSLFGIMGLFVVGHDKIRYLGTFEQYHRNIDLLSITSTSMLPSMLLTWLSILTCWGYLLFRFRSEARITTFASRT